MKPCAILSIFICLLFVGCVAPSEGLTQLDDEKPDHAEEAGLEQGTLALEAIFVCTTTCSGHSAQHGGEFQLPRNVTDAEVVIAWTPEDLAPEEWSVSVIAPGRERVAAASGASPLTLEWTEDPRPGTHKIRVWPDGMDGTGEYDQTFEWEVTHLS